MIPTFTFTKNDLACFLFWTLSYPVGDNFAGRHRNYISFVPSPDDWRARMVANEGYKESSKITGVPIMSILGWASNLIPTAG